ncbi:hypothetical protein [Ruegeria sp. HKCCA4008]|uniref:lipase/acyltransferase domain-containing protein n=1 Tax=Ruegeria sp. HKCCA4008 TaxID=2682999 RepID=UPI001489B841|nr:hypothetical protein [Ruegeria sp. HKCCA4008]
MFHKLVFVVAISIATSLSSNPTRAQGIDAARGGGFNLPGSKNKIVFVPGILGSRLAVDDKDIWVSANVLAKDFFFSPDQNVKTSVLTSLNAFDREIMEVAYGPFFSEQASDPGSREYFFPFSYDWRSSNVVSSRKLGNFLCNVSNDSKRPIILIAHSMGGLVVKHWIMNEFDKTCKNGKRVEIGAIVFVATPHTGSPKSLISLMDGTDLFGIEAIDRVAMYAVNKYGYTFDSIYELLPFGTAQDEEGYCYTKEEMESGPKRLRIYYLKGTASEPDAMDPFSITFMESLGILEKIENLAEDFPEEIGNPREYLERKLKSAEKIACSMARFRLPEELNDRVIYLAGRIVDKRSVGLETTVSEIWLTNVEDRRRRVKLEFQDPVSGYPLYLYEIIQDGDETVPFDIATNLSDSDKFNRVVNRTRRANSDHLGVLTSLELHQVVDQASNFEFSWNSSTDIRVLPRPGNLPDEVDRIDMALAVDGGTSTQDELPLLTDWITEDGLFKVVEYKSSSEVFFGKLLDHEEASLSMGTKPSAFQETLKGSFDTVWDVRNFAAKNPTADNWRFVGSVEGLPANVRAEAKFKAAEMYWIDGRMDEAIAAYADIVESNEFQEVKTSDGYPIQSFAKIGFNIASSYTGPSIILTNDVNRQKLDVSDPKEWASGDLMKALIAIEDNGRFDSKNWNGNIVSSFSE